MPDPIQQPDATASGAQTPAPATSATLTSSAASTPPAANTPQPDPVATNPRDDLPRETGATSAAAQTAAPSSTPSQAAAAQSGDASQAGSLRDAAKQYGLDLSQYPDDFAALQALAGQVQQAKQLQQLAQYGQLYVQHAEAFQRWQAEQAAAAQKPVEKPKFWNPPEWKPEWSNLLTKDDKGNVVPVPGAPADILQKFNAHEQYKRDFANRLLSNPEEALGQLIEDRAQAVAEKLVGAQLGGYQDRVWADNFVAQNSSWLHVRDQAGNIQRDPITGAQLLTPEGQRYRDYVVQAERAGVKDIRQMDVIARAMLERDIALAQLDRAKAGAANDAAKNNLIQTQNRAQHAPNSGGSENGGSPNPGQSVEQNQKLSLADRLRRDLLANGIKDGDFAGR
jgi:hypothetical protein